MVGLNDRKILSLAADLLNKDRSILHVSLSHSLVSFSCNDILSVNGTPCSTKTPGLSPAKRLFHNKAHLNCL